MINVVVRFPGDDDAERGQLAIELTDEISSTIDVMPTVIRERTDSQDAGTLISIALGAPAVVALVKGIANWMARRNQSEVEILLPDGRTVKLRNMRSEDVSSAIASLEKVVK